jgi:hypothetical protein
MADDDYFDDVEKLRLKGPLPPLPASARVRSKRIRQDGEFIVISREQSDRLDKARWFGSERVFRHLLFLTWRAPDTPVKVGNIAFNRKGTDRRITYIGIGNSWPYQSEMGTRQIAVRDRSASLICTVGRTGDMYAPRYRFDHVRPTVQIRPNCTVGRTYGHTSFYTFSLTTSLNIRGLSYGRTMNGRKNAHGR